MSEQAPDRPPALSPPRSRRAQILARVAFVVLLGGVLALWAWVRSPRELRLDIDLTAAQPGELAEVDVVVTRGGQAISRSDERYGPQGAPATLQLLLRARPGAFEVETTLVDAAHRARRTRTLVQLREGTTAVVQAD